MGGIIGKLSFERHQTLAHPVLEQMLDAAWHRGSNSRGIHIAPGIALGWRGDEPATHPGLPGSRFETAGNAQRTVLAVVDAAIANAPALRAALIRAGHVIEHSADAALVAHAYEEWGDGFVDRLRGTYALAVWDARARRLLLARDHSGARPLYYALLQGHGVAFGSTIRALLTDPGVGREWCPAALDAYLAYGYVPAPFTPYQRISKLEPGYRLVVDGRRFQIERSGLPAPGATADGRPLEVLESTLTRLAAEQPAGTGVMFSGGYASAAIVATARSRPAVVIGLEQETGDLARAYAQAQDWGVEAIVDVASPDLTSVAAEAAALADEPHADAALVAHYAVCLTARRHLDAALTGHGGTMLWSERQPEPGPWTEAERFSVYTRRFARRVLDAPSAEPAPWSESLATAGRLGLAAGIRLYFPHTDPQLVALAATARPTEGHLLRTLVARHTAAAPDPRPRRRCDQHPWLRGAIRTMVPALLLGERFDGRGMIAPDALRQMWAEHRLGRRDHAQRFWSLLMLELWFREFVDGGAIDAPLEYAFARAA